jgi:hypothetical protein
MTHEISQLDIPDRQLLASNTRPNVWTEIGEAQITHTIFGRAKVRIVRKNDGRHRILWIAGIAVIAIAVAVWQGFISQQAEEAPGITTSVRTEEPPSAPAIQAEKTPPPATTPEASKEPVAPVQVEINKPAIAKGEAPQAQTSNFAEPGSVKREMPRPKPHMVPQKPVLTQPKPVITEPKLAEKPQAVPYAGIQTGKTPTGSASPSNPILPKPKLPAVAVVAKPAAAAASSPGAAMQLSDPLQKPVPAIDSLPPPTDSVQGK